MGPQRSDHAATYDAFTAHRHQRCNIGLATGDDIGPTVKAVVGNQRLNRAQPGRVLFELLELREHRHDLLFVVHRLRHILGNDQQTTDGYRRLRVIGLLEAAAGDGHDARLGIGEIGLILYFGVMDDCFNSFACGFSAYGWVGHRCRVQQNRPWFRDPTATSQDGRRVGAQAPSGTCVQIPESACR